ncbi:MAG: hypothetical protein II863_07810 [Kiritimatiellae bacterium]|nr:hypothetical protein [Kiritimatiellia bacterium]
MGLEHTKQMLARHEAAHFVIAWATETPRPYVDITPAGQKVCNNDPTHVIMGRTFGSNIIPTPFNGILNDLAGPVADYWGQGIDCLLEGEKEDIERALASIAEGEYINQDDGDWDSCFRNMAQLGVDVLDKVVLKDALPQYLDAVRSILNLCEKEWQEVTEHLVIHERIGWNGEHWDQGEDAERFFFKWDGNFGEPSEEVKSRIKEYCASLPRQTIRPCSGTD